jgi:Non-repetitive/WGA-negative nucleoporin C-terminal
VEYLSLAVGNAKSHQVPEYDHMDQAPVEFLNDLEEQLEVANVQLEVYDAMQSLSGLSQEALRDVEELGTYLTHVTDVRSVNVTPIAHCSDLEPHFPSCIIDLLSLIDCTT